MNLHEDNEAFSEFVQLTAETFGLPQVYVEKDYWITKSLKHLSESAHVDDVVFKGGTSLSKAYRLLHRFSEDIDLAVFKGDKSNNALKNQIKDVETVVTQSLIYLEDGVRVLSRLMANSRSRTGVKIRFVAQRKRSKSLAFRIFHAKNPEKTGFTRI